MTQCQRQSLIFNAKLEHTKKNVIDGIVGESSKRVRSKSGLFGGVFAGASSQPPRCNHSGRSRSTLRCTTGRKWRAAQALMAAHRACQGVGITPIAPPALGVRLLLASHQRLGPIDGGAPGATQCTAGHPEVPACRWAFGFEISQL